MLRRPPRSTRTDTLFPYTTLFLSGPCITALSGLTVRMICINHANANYCDLASQSNTHIPAAPGVPAWDTWRSEEHTSELQSLMRTTYAVFCLKKQTKLNSITTLII